MIKLGDTINVNYGESTSKFWLVKNENLKRMSKEIPELINKHYVVLGFIKGKGWYTVNNGTLKEMRKFINKFANC